MHSVLLLLTEAQTSPLAWQSVALAEALMAQGIQVKVFFYQDAASIANRLSWRPSDEPSLTQAWQRLAIDLPVCVSAALLRGVTDLDNAMRHHLLDSHDAGQTLAEGFQLVGLGELADAMLQAERVIHL